MITDDQWAYGAILNYWDRWKAARIEVYHKRPKRRSSMALAFAIAAATAVSPRVRRYCAKQFFDVKLKRDDDSIMEAGNGPEDRR